MGERGVDLKALTEGMVATERELTHLAMRTAQYPDQFSRKLSDIDDWLESIWDRAESTANTVDAIQQQLGRWECGQYVAKVLPPDNDQDG